MQKLLLSLLIIFLLQIGNIAQVNFTVNSLADDDQSHAWDNPNTSVDESEDGICQDENGRCTIRAAIEEAENMNQSVNLTFSVSGTINVNNFLYLPDGSTMDGNNQVGLAGMQPLTIENNCTIEGMRIQDAIAGLYVVGTGNKIGTIGGHPNEFVNCQSVGLTITATGNKVYNNYFGITESNEVMPNGVGIMITESDNEIGKNEIGSSNIICGNSVAGIIIGFGSHNIVENNYIGTNIEGHTGIGNAIGVTINSDSNLIGGSGTFSPNVISGNQIGISITAAPPDTYADQNLVVNNIIGLSAQQDVAIPNDNGISITNGTINAKIYDNVISGNNAAAIGIFAYDPVSYTSGHLIYRNKIGVNKNGVEYGNGYGISIYGNVEDVTIGVDEINNYVENTIVGNQEGGIDITSFQSYSPNEIVFRKNILHNNTINNIFIDSLTNLGLKKPFGLSFNGNTLSGNHPLPSITIDVYRANRFELAASAYEWLGSTTTSATGNFSFLVNDPTVESITVTATNPLTGSTSGFARLDLVTSVEDDQSIPTEFSLNQNYPNPFNPTTKISWQSPVSGHQSIKVFDILGNEVATLIDEYKEAGKYELNFDASDLTSGVYFYKLQAGSFVETKKMLLIK